VRAHLGLTTDGQLSSMVQAQHLAILNAAARKVQQECSWISATDRQTFTLGVQENVLNLPGGTKAGSIRAIAVYADNRYYALQPRVLPVQSDTDQEMIVGGETLQRMCGRPRYYQERAKQVYFWPRADIEYPVRMEWLKSFEYAAEGDILPCDAQLIIYAATFMLAALRGDEVQKGLFEKLYGDRMIALRGWQQAGTEFMIDSEADFAEDEFMRDDKFPNWNRNPTVNAT
jgi:hypothetical protein